MNGLIFFGIAHYLIYLPLLRRLQPQRLRRRLRALQSALERRDYGLRSLVGAEHASERCLDSCVDRQLRAGKLELQTIEALARLWEEVAELSARCEKALLLSLLHGGLCFSLALGLHLLLQGKGSAQLCDDAALLLACGFYGFMLFGLLRALPWPGLLCQERCREEFFQAWFELADAGPWEVELKTLREQAWRHGLSQSETRRRILRRWWRQEMGCIDRRLAVHEELRSLWELAAASGLGLILWSGPLMSRLDGVW